jgi:methylenetetrahydrofolate dehydrogenase (NADP+) / methenyltetrahydrofolate cyclohydrolase
MMQIIDGKKLRDEILTKIKSEVALLSFQPIFCDVLVGEDIVSRQYVEMKARYAEKVGIKFHDAFFPFSIPQEELIEEIKKINNLKNICGIIVQLPLPSHLNQQNILDSIDPTLDVDCLGSKRSQEFYAGNISLGFPTALSCLALLDSINLDLKNKKIIVLGNGSLVGRPVTALLSFRGFFPTVITSKTEDKEELIKEADIIISGIGKGKYLTGEMLKKGVVLIDAGTSESNASIVGDVDLESVKEIASFVSPVPGGVGPVTVAMLLNNVLQVAKNRKA